MIAGTEIIKSILRTEAEQVTEEAKRALVGSGKGRVGVSFTMGASTFSIRWHIRNRVRKKGRSALISRWIAEGTHYRVSPYSLVRDAEDHELDVFAEFEPMFRVLRREQSLIGGIEKKFGQDLTGWTPTERAIHEAAKGDRRAIYKEAESYMVERRNELRKEAEEASERYRERLKQCSGYLSVGYRDTETSFVLRWYIVTKYAKYEGGSKVVSRQIPKGRGFKVPVKNLGVNIRQDEKEVFKEAEGEFSELRKRAADLVASIRQLNTLLRVLETPEFVDADYVKESQKRKRETAIKRLKKQESAL